jgi:ketosteroid isomerase-like protein
MNRRSVVTLIAMASACLWIVLPASNAAAQQAADIAGVRTVSEAFYAALAALDHGVAMEKVWAHTPYVTFVGPRSKSIIVGWDANKRYWEDADKLFSARNVWLAEAHIHANGNLAWEIGQEAGEAKLKDGTVRKVDQFVTNVYERQADGRWLMVSHHVQPKPQ